MERMEKKKCFQSEFNKELKDYTKNIKFLRMQNNNIYLNIGNDIFKRQEFKRKSIELFY